jgi:hypothetical protein
MIPITDAHAILNTAVRNHVKQLILLYSSMEICVEYAHENECFVYVIHEWNWYQTNKKYYLFCNQQAIDDARNQIDGVYQWV